MLRGSSGRSEAAARGWLHTALSAGADAARWSQQLFAVVDALDTSVALQRSLTNPNRDEQAKRALVSSILHGCEADLVTFVADTASQRWSRDGDLGEALEVLAFEAELTKIENAHSLEKVEDEFFEIDRFLVGQRDVREALSDDEADSDAKGQLAATIFAGKIAPETLSVLVRLATHPRGRSMANSLSFISGLIAERRRRLVAQVITAVPLDGRQTSRLGDILEKLQGRPVQVNLTVDPEVIGGLRIRVGDSAINATLVRRLLVAQRAITA